MNFWGQLIFLGSINLKIPRFRERGSSQFGKPSTPTLGNQAQVKALASPLGEPDG
jgi:hypothetical protein